MPVPSCTASVSVSVSLSLFVSACFFFASAILLKVSKGKGRNEKESKGMEWELLCSVLYILLDTCLARSSTSTNNERSQPPLLPILDIQSPFQIAVSTSPIYILYIDNLDYPSIISILLSRLGRRS